MPGKVEDPWPNASGFDTDYEEHSPVALTVRGNIPRYAAGVLYRTGPLGFKIKTNESNIWSANHWFDGFSCVHRFQIEFSDENGPARVTYRSRRTVDEYLELVKKTGKLDSITFASKRDPCESFFKKVMSIFKASRDTRNVGVTLSINMPGAGSIGIAEKPPVSSHTAGIETLHVKTDSFLLKNIDPETLEPRGIATQTNLHPDLKGPFSAAHAKTDPTTGDLYNFNLELGYNAIYRIFRTSATNGKTEILARFPGKPAYLHSLFLTRDHVVLCVNILDAISPFDSSKKALWYVVDRHGKGLIATYESDPFFCFHTINAWEEPSSDDSSKIDIIAELCMYDNLDVIHRFYYDNLMSTTHASSNYVGKKRESCLPMQAQFRLSKVNSTLPSSKHVAAEILFKADKKISLELPTINPSYIARRHRFTYGVADRLKSSFMDGIVKFDNVTQNSIFWETNAHTPGEPIFVADPNGATEDDGILLSVVLDGINEKSYLLVLDAKNLSELGRADMQGPMSFGFHGAYKATDGKYGGDV